MENNEVEFLREKLNEMGMLLHMIVAATGDGELIIPGDKVMEIIAASGYEATASAIVAEHDPISHDIRITTQDL